MQGHQLKGCLDDAMHGKAELVIRAMHGQLKWYRQGTA